MKRTIFALLSVLLLAFAFKSTEYIQLSPAQPIAGQSKTLYTLPSFTAPAYFDQTNWTVKGRQILKDGNPFFAKGVCYQPVPIGAQPNDYPNGDYFMAESRGIYEPDLDLMGVMGVNCIKIYSWYPDKDHSGFLNYAYSKGIYVIVGYYSPNNDIKTKFDVILKQFETLAKNTAQHPAIMGYQLGNENVGSDQMNADFWNKFNQIAARLKSVAPNKIVTTGLVDDGMITVKTGNSYMTSLDAWGINVFRGKSLGDFYESYMKQSSKPVLITELGFSAATRGDDKSQWPAGVPMELPDNAKYIADLTDDVLQEIHDNSSDDEPDDPVAGVFMFEWCDEWWKQNDPTCLHRCVDAPSCSKNTHDFFAAPYWKPGTFYDVHTVVTSCAGPNDFFECTTAHTSGSSWDAGKWKQKDMKQSWGGYWDEEWFGLYTADIPRRPRASVKVIKNLWKP